MSDYLPEKQILKKLGIKDFKEISRKKTIHFASILDKMAPEVAQKALEQFPEFTKTCSEILNDSGYIPRSSAA